MSALDLTRPEHHEALQWWCSKTPEERATWQRMLDAGRWPEDVTRLVITALSSPSDSAAIARALLEGCGVNAHVEQWPMTADGDYVVKWDADEGTYNHGSHIEITRDMENVPVLILRLLACTTKEEALAALGEVGR